MLVYIKPQKYPMNSHPIPMIFSLPAWHRFPASRRASRHAPAAGSPARCAPARSGAVRLAELDFRWPDGWGKHRLAVTGH